MATQKQSLFKEAQAAGLVAEDTTADDYDVAGLERLLGRGPAWEGSRSSDVPLIAADGHANLSQEDLDARQ